MGVEGSLGGIAEEKGGGLKGITEKTSCISLDIFPNLIFLYLFIPLYDIMQTLLMMFIFLRSVLCFTK